MNEDQLTHQQQIEELKSNGIIVTDEKRAKKILQNLNYTRLQQYMIHIPRDHDTYAISLLKIYDIYEMDRQLRLLLLEYLEKIEISMRAKVSYYHTNVVSLTSCAIKTNASKKIIEELDQDRST